MTRAGHVLACLAIAAGFTPALGAAREDVWNFSVYLDDDRVGSHRFVLKDDGAGRTLQSDARFDVKILMINAYRYVHRADERWRGECLEDLQATTDDNGEAFSVSGQMREGLFRLRAGPDERSLDGCVMTFAYWNPAMRRQARLLNPQTGEYLPVRFEPKGTDSLPVHGQTVAAERLHLDAGKFQIDLWYADGERWVALDSTLENGRKLRYRIE